MHTVEEMIKYLPDDKAFGCVAKYLANLMLMEEYDWSLNPKMLPDTGHNIV